MTACPNHGWWFTVDVDATYQPPTGDGFDVAAALSPAIDEPLPSTDLQSGVQVGEYRVDKKIGEGGMGAVYSATHPMIGKRAAIKVISTALGTDASAVNRFVQEARSVNQIGHPNIVDVFAFGTLPDGRNYFIMEYLQGESLADRIQRVAMPLDEALEILDQVADALEAAHEKQIVHRDLKPDNIYLAAIRRGRTLVKLLDFGIAKLAGPDGPGSGGVQKTLTGMLMGTPGYLSPEQARGKNVDHRTDVYALGCVLFEVACGRLPFIADNAMDIVLMHMTTPPIRASAVWPDIPAPLDELIARMLDKDASLRPTLAEVRAVFSELVTSRLVTLNNAHGVAFGSGISRTMAMPAHRIPRRITNNALAIGTKPEGEPPANLPPPNATIPLAVGKSKTGLFAGIALVTLLGGAGAIVAITRGGGSPSVEKTPIVTTTTESPKPIPPEPPKPVVPSTQVPVVPTITPIPNSLPLPRAPDAVVTMPVKRSAPRPRPATRSQDLGARKLPATLPTTIKPPATDAGVMIVDPYTADSADR